MHRNWSELWQSLLSVHLKDTRVNNISSNCLVTNSDGVSIIARHPSKLNVLWSGSQDGQIRKWSLTSRKTTRKIQAHDGWVRGLAVSKTDKVVTVGVDKQIKLWEGDEFSDSPEIATIIGKSPFTSCDFALGLGNYGKSFFRGFPLLTK